MDTPKTRSETLRESIEELIAVGKLAPGQHLDETSLAEEFGVSRTPIREALIQLASMGIVEMRPHKAEGELGQTLAGCGFGAEGSHIQQRAVLGKQLEGTREGLLPGM